MNIEQKINYQLNRYPYVKKIIKRTYQLMMYAVSPKVISQGNIIRITPNDGSEYFFGYYDKSPWDSTSRYMLCMKAKKTWKDVAPRDPIELLLIDLCDNNKIIKIGESRSWNVQQGCMLQWLGPDFSTRVIYNDFRNGKFVSVIFNIKTLLEEKVIDSPIYSLSNDGSIALTLDFTRLHRLRKGYGYSNIEELTNNEKCPDKPCIWKVDISSGNITPFLNYSDFAAFETRIEMNNAEHKVNHIMLSPDGKRFMVLHRWFNGFRKYTRLITCDIETKEMYNLSDDDMVSHCYWKNDKYILAFENKHISGPGYYLMKDQSKDFIHLWKELSCDGHPSYQPNGDLVITDTYPDRARVASVKLIDGDKIKTIAKVHAPFKYDNDTRCDLHPRWSRDGKQICFDAVFEGYRGLYIIPNIDE